MALRAPYLSRDELRHRADQFLKSHNADGRIPVPIEHIIEFRFGLDIVPVPGLQSSFDVDAYLTKDMSEIRIDQYVYDNRINRYRFSLAHELAHRILHSDLWRELDFDDIVSWKSVMADSIPDRDYGYIEYHANCFAGLILVPVLELAEYFSNALGRIKKTEFDLSSEETGPARQIVESYIARHFEVSPAVIRYRVESDGLWSAI